MTLPVPFPRHAVALPDRAAKQLAMLAAETGQPALEILVDAIDVFSDPSTRGEAAMARQTIGTVVRQAQMVRGMVAEMVGNVGSLGFVINQLRPQRTGGAGMTLQQFIAMVRQGQETPPPAAEPPAPEEFAEESAEERLRKHRELAFGAKTEPLCSSCRGTGKIVAQAPILGGDDVVPTMDCPTCAGTGRAKMEENAEP